MNSYIYELERIKKDVFLDILKKSFKGEIEIMTNEFYDDGYGTFPTFVHNIQMEYNKEITTINAIQKSEFSEKLCTIVDMDFDNGNLIFNNELEKYFPFLFENSPIEDHKFTQASLYFKGLNDLSETDYIYVVKTYWRNNQNKDKKINNED